ncbi:MAG: hypothetical protein EP346_01995, partial [Bacteroidetes bacterium]
MLKYKATNGLKFNFIFALLGNVGYAAFQFLLLTVFVRLYSTEEIGVFNYVGAFVLPITLAFDLQLRSLYLTGTEEGHYHSYHRYRNRVNFFAFAVLLISTQFTDSEYFWYVLILGTMKLLENQSNLYYGLFHKIESTQRVAMSRWIKTGGTFVVTATVGILWKPDFLTLLWVYLGTNILLFVAFDLRWALQFGRKVADVPTPIKHMIVLTIPMVIIALIEKYYINYPKLALEQFFGLEAIGIVGTLYYFRMIGSQIVGSLSTATQSRYGELLKVKNYRGLDKFVALNVAIGGGLGIGLTLVFWLFGERIITLLFTEAYTAYMDALMLILLASTAGFAYTFLGAVFNAFRQHRWKVLFQGVSFAVLLILTYYRHET